MSFELVYTTWDFYDGPRSGIANYLEQPHYYECEWDNDKDDYAKTFILTPIDDETLSLALEQWTIWRQWETTFHRGDVPLSSHPGYSGNDPKYDELEVILKKRISNLSTSTKKMIAEFRARSDQETLPSGTMRYLEVEWKELDPL